MQRYGDFGLIPRNLPDSCRSCCDKGKYLRQSRGGGLECVVKNIKKLNLFVVILMFFPTFAEFYKFNP